MKGKYKLLLLVLIFFSLFINILCFFKFYNNFNEEKIFIGYYECENNSLKYNLFKDNTLMINDNTYYSKSIFKKIGYNILSYENSKGTNLIFWNGNSYILYESKTNQVFELKKLTSQNVTLEHLKEKSDGDVAK